MGLYILGEQVIQKEYINTGLQIAKIETPFCMLHSYKLIDETETYKIYQSTKFDIGLGEYVDCFDDNFEVEINGQLYNPINGIITVPKQSQ